MPAGNVLFAHPLPATLLPVLLGTAVGFSTNQKRTKAMYRTLRQPPLNPPGWVFGPVWTCLYAGMGYASHRAWVAGISSPNPRIVELTKTGALLYGAQLILNLIWTPLFFSLFRPVEAALDIVGLFGVVGCLAYTWSEVEPVSSWLLAPYLAWLGFATYLCVGAGYLNNWDFGHVQLITGKEDKED